MLNKGNEIILQISKYEITKKEKIKAIITSLLLSLIIFMGPITLFINLYIFNDIKYLACFLVATFVGLIYYFTNYFYYKAISKGSLKKAYYIYLPYYLSFQIVLYFIYILLILRRII